MGDSASRHSPNGVMYAKEQGIMEPCPDEELCDIMPYAENAAGPIVWNIIVFQVALFGLYYMKLRPSFSSYIVTILVHLIVFTLILCINFVSSAYLILVNNTYRNMIGLCKRTEFQDEDGKCLPMCKNEESFPQHIPMPEVFEPFVDDHMSGLFYACTNFKGVYNGLFSSNTVNTDWMNY